MAGLFTRKVENSSENSPFFSAAEFPFAPKSLTNDRFDVRKNIIANPMCEREKNGRETVIQIQEKLLCNASFALNHKCAYFNINLYIKSILNNYVIGMIKLNV